VLIILVLLFVVIGYPLMFGKCGCFSERQGFVSTVIAFVFSVISLIRILPQYFIFSEQEYKQKQNNELSKEIEVDVTKELSILKDVLIKNGRNELKESILIDDINGDVNVRLSDKKNEAFFVINANIKTSNVEQIVRWIEKYSFNFFRDLNDTSVDINSFVHSYVLYIDGIKEPKMFFIRARRTELEDAFAKSLNPTEFVNSIKNKVIDELFRSV
jgi:hypothetical protein